MNIASIRSFSGPRYTILPSMSVLMIVRTFTARQSFKCGWGSPTCGLRFRTRGSVEAFIRPFHRIGSSHRHPQRGIRVSLLPRSSFTASHSCRAACGRLSPLRSGCLTARHAVRPHFSPSSAFEDPQRFAVGFQFTWVVPGRQGGFRHRAHLRFPSGEAFPHLHALRASRRGLGQVRQRHVHCHVLGCPVPASIIASRFFSSTTCWGLKPALPS